MADQLAEGEVAGDGTVLAAGAGGEEHAALGGIGLVEADVAEAGRRDVAEEAGALELALGCDGGVGVPGDERADGALLLHEGDRRAPRIEQVRDVGVRVDAGAVQLALRAAELAPLGRIEGVVLAAVLEGPFAHPRHVHADLEGRDRPDGGEVVVHAPEVRVVGVGGDARAAHEGKQGVLGGGESRQLAVAVEPGVQHLVGDRRRVLAEFLEVGVAGLGELLHRALGGGRLAAGDHLAQGRQQEADEEADDPDHHQEFDEREAAGDGAAGGRRGGGGGVLHWISGE